MSEIHICSVPHETSRTYLPFPAKNPFHRFLRSLQLMVTIWKRHPYFTLYCRSTTIYYAERKRHIMGKYFYIIHPLSLFCFIYEMVLLVSYTILFFYYPLVTGFESKRKGLSTHLEVKSLNVFLETILMTEIILRFFIGRKPSAYREVILNHPQIIKSYVFSFMFLVDLCSAVPYSYYSSRVGLDAFNVGHILKIIRNMKVLRMGSYISYFKKFLCIIGLNAYNGIIIFFLMTAFVVHWCTCLLFGVKFYGNVLRNYSLAENLHSFYFSLRRLNTTTQRYVEVISRATSALLSTHRIVYMKDSADKMIVSLIITVFGRLFMLILGVVFINQVLRLNERATKYRQVLNQVDQYMKRKKLPAETRARLLSFYEYKFQGQFIKEYQIQNMLSGRLNKEISYHANTRLVKKVEILQEIPTNTLTDVLNLLKIEVYLPNDIIINAGTATTSMYFMSFGTVCLTTASGREVCHIEDGGYFGEAAFVLNQKKSSFSVTALEISEVYRLDFKGFKKYLKGNQEIMAKLKAGAESREKEIAILENEFQERLFQRTYLGDRPNQTGGRRPSVRD